MRLSLNWLQDYVDIQHLSAAELAQHLTHIGLEVETIEQHENVKGRVVVGKILEAQKHPNADNLRLCLVDAGLDEPLQIVCGAPNADAGKKVVVACVGSVLPGDFKIKKSKIRGVESMGMMCSEKELRLSQEHDCIIELSDDHEIGQSITEIFPLNDTIFTLSITPNRADCFGYIGVARDLAAKLDIPIKTPLLDDGIFNPDLDTHKFVEIKVEDAHDCPRFVALYIDHLQNQPSPIWMQQRLEASGMRPLNLIVDVTNYVMLEQSQPIHAYDARFIKGGQICVRRAGSDKTIQTLDGKNHPLHADDLLICDASGPIGLAGIMGGLNSEVKEDTTAIIVEVASFAPKLIRSTARRLGIHTEASHRFERGTDICAIPYVAQRVAHLLYTCAQEQKISPPRCAATLIDVQQDNNLSQHTQQIALRVQRAKKILGYPLLNARTCKSILERLGCQILDQTDDKDRILIRTPSWRHDLYREIDLIEEVGRIIGYDQITPALPRVDLSQNIQRNTRIDQFMEDVKQAAAQLGISESINFPFCSMKQLDQLNLPDDHFYRRHLIRISNPLSEHEAYLQFSPVVGLLAALARNKRHDEQCVKLFEVARGYLSPTAIETAQEEQGYFAHYLNRSLLQHHKDKFSSERAIEKVFLNFVIGQPWITKSWDTPQVYSNFFHVKSIILKWTRAFLTNQQRIEFCRLSSQESRQLPFLNPGQSAMIKLDTYYLGYAGCLHPRVCHAWDFEMNAAPVIAEIDLETLFKQAQRPTNIETRLHKYPPTRRDIALLVPRELTYAQLEDALRLHKSRLLNNFELFDIYYDDKLDPTHKSVALHLAFRSHKKTLHDKEVDREIDQLLTHLNKMIGAKPRY